MGKENYQMINYFIINYFRQLSYLNFDNEPCCFNFLAY